MKNLTLNNGQTAQFLYEDDWGRPVYKLDCEVKVCCVNLDGTYLHTMCGDEPNAPLKQEYQPQKGEDTRGADLKHEYMLLSRFQTDIEYYFGHGNRCEKHLYHDTIGEHIREMKKLHNSFPDDLKPEWLTMEQIIEYEKKVS